MARQNVPSGNRTKIKGSWKMHPRFVTLPYIPLSSLIHMQCSDTAQPGGEEAGRTTEENCSGGSKPPVARMCSVSHCRRILAIGSSFKRCDQHRIQNRHHSRLKREREKEVKAQAMAAWVKASAPGPDTPAATEESPSTNTSMDLNSENHEPSATTEVGFLTSGLSSL
jgi:hypothetical protein